MQGSAELPEAIFTTSTPLDSDDDIAPLIDMIGDARFVLLGEASHGTHDYYLWRARISRRLIEEKGFRFVAVEGDWPDCFRINQYVQGEHSASNATDVLRAFSRWPTWMWANWEVVAFTEWLHATNAQRSEGEQVGFYGLDVYSLWESLNAVIDYLTKHRPDALSAAIEAFRCFEPYGEDPQSYALATRFIPDDCEDEVVRLLTEIVRHVNPDGTGSLNDFNALMNAEALKDAEAYYRAMISGGAESWNVRDRHMARTLDHLMEFYGGSAKAIVWEHNTHIGDARFTDMARVGMVNVGQLVREAHESDGVVLAGFGSFRGEVIASRVWDGPIERMSVPPARGGSWEAELHQLGGENRLLRFRHQAGAGAALAAWRGHRAIGVVYHPEAESGNYVPTDLPSRYDAFLYIDETTALHPLHVAVGNEPPELFPWGV